MSALKDETVFVPNYAIAQNYKKFKFSNHPCKLPNFISFDEIENNFFRLSANIPFPIKAENNFFKCLMNSINSGISLSDALELQKKNKNSLANNNLFEHQKETFKQLQNLDLTTLKYIPSYCPTLYDFKFEMFFKSIGVKSVEIPLFEQTEIEKIQYDNNLDFAKKLIHLRTSNSSSVKIILDDKAKFSAVNIFEEKIETQIKSSDTWQFSFFQTIIKYVECSDFSNALNVIMHPHYNKRISHETLNLIRNLEFKTHDRLINILGNHIQALDLIKLKQELKSTLTGKEFLTTLMKIHKELVFNNTLFAKEYGFIAQLSFELKVNSANDLIENFATYINTFSKFNRSQIESIVINDINQLAFLKIDLLIIDDEILKNIESNFKHLSIGDLVYKLPAKRIFVLYKNNSEHSSLLFDQKIKEHIITLSYQKKPVIQFKKPELCLKKKPLRISVSGIEKLIRNPYVFGLQYILNLRPLTGIFEQSAEKNFGILAHDVISSFCTRYDLSFLEKFESFKPNLVHKISKFTDDLNVKNLWLQSLKTILNWWDEELKKFPSSKFYFEAQGRSFIGEIEVTARADLIRDDFDLVDIIDFKTGAIPTNNEVASGLFPQLTLEAHILSSNGFEVAKPRPIEMHYIKLSSKDDAMEIKKVANSSENIALELKKLFDNTLNSGCYFTTFNDDDMKLLQFKHLIRKEEWFDQF